MSGTITMTGLVSNTDWTKLMTDMIEAQKAAATSPYTTSKTNYQTKLAAWQSFNLTLSSIVDFIDNNSLNGDEGYAIYTSSLSSSDTSITPSDILNVTIGNATGPGSYDIEVTTLAQAEKIVSDTFTSKTNALDISGDIIVNGKKVTLAAADNLLEVADKINDANAGVTATILTVSDSVYKLILESESTGAAGMSLKNGSSSEVLESLNLHATTKQLAHASGADALSDTYTSRTSAVGTLLDLTTKESGTIQIRGTDDTFYSVAIDLSTDTLESIVTKINTANGGGAIPGVTASVEQVTENGATRYQLKLTNVDATDFQDDKNILETLGVLENTLKNTALTTGQDAALKIDGFSITSSSNTITDAIQGVTLNLTGTNVGKEIELKITQDTAKISDNVSSLISNINSTLTYIKDQNTYSEDSTKPLMGDSNLTSVRNRVIDTLYEEVVGNTEYTTASSIGITFGKDGVLSVNSTTLANALSDNRQEVINVLKSLNDNLYDSFKGYVDPLTGTFKYIETSLTDSISRIDARLEELDKKFEREKELLEKRFTALETLIASSNMTKNWLTQQADYMTGQNK